MWDMFTSVVSVSGNLGDGVEGSGSGGKDTTSLVENRVTLRGLKYLTRSLGI